MKRFRHWKPQLNFSRRTPTHTITLPPLTVVPDVKTTRRSSSPSTEKCWPKVAERPAFKPIHLRQLRSEQSNYWSARIDIGFFSPQVFVGNGRCFRTAEILTWVARAGCFCVSVHRS